MAGPGDYDLMEILPPGTKTHQCEVASSGHMMLPCAAFPQAAATPKMALNLQQQISFPVEPEAAPGHREQQHREPSSISSAKPSYGRAAPVADAGRNKSTARARGAACFPPPRSPEAESTAGWELADPAVDQADD